MIPINTQMKTKLSIHGGNSSHSPHIQLTVYTEDVDVVVRMVVVFAEGIFDGTVLVVK